MFPKSVLISLGLTATQKIIATISAIEKKMFRSDVTTQIISNEEVDDIMEEHKFL